MRNALCLVVLALAFAVPAAIGEREETRRRAPWREHAEAGPRHVAALAVKAIGASSLLFATADGFLATGVRFDAAAPDGLAGWTVGWPAPR